ncbi:hypothetical protein [Halovivax sp.]|uniref:hypothetical protein n=1 Tax=Halovivax sp. TaxID=1935978 RepID=UPI0025B98AFE|nr:hypothetical protein [Halovivax sp.]
MDGLLLTALGMLLIIFGTAAAWQPEAAIEVQQSHGPGLFADADDAFVDDMVAATPWIGGVLAWIGVGLVLYVFFF